MKILNKILLSALLISSVSEAYDFADFKTDLSAPIDNYEAHPYLWSGLSATSFLVLFREDLVEPFQDDYSSKRPMGNASHFGDLMGQLVPNLLYSGAMYAHYKYTGDDKSFARMSHMLKTTVYAGGVTTILKRVVRQRRPDSSDTNSFPSGHTTTAFAFASVVATEHDWYWGAAAYSLASFVAMSRINDNVHYLHDVIAGATIGVAYGVAFYQQEFKSRTAKNAGNYIFLPINNGIYAGLEKRF